MGIRSLFERRTASTTGGVITDVARGRLSGSSTVNESRALTHSAVWRGTNLYADLISTLPWQAFRDVDGVAARVKPTPSLLTAPAVSVKAIAWRAAVVRSLIMRGNAYGLILSRDRYGWPTTIELQHPDTVSGKWDAATLETEWRIGGTKVPADDVWHVTINEVPGSPFGLSMISYAALSIRSGLSAAQYSADFFAGGGHPSALITTDQNLTGEQLDDAKSRWLKARRESDPGAPALLGSGWTYAPIQISPEDTQFLDAIGASVADVARFLGLPPEMIGGSAGDSMTYSNVESRSLDLLKYSINPVLRRLEEALTVCMPNAWYVKANRAALLEMTTLERYRAHSLALRDGWRNVDEVRSLEELPPLADGQGETYRIPTRINPSSGGGDEAPTP